MSFDVAALVRERIRSAPLAPLPRKKCV